MNEVRLAVAPSPSVAARPLVASTARVFRDCLRESRPIVQVMFLVRFLVGGVLSRGHLLHAFPRFAGGAVIWSAAAVCIYLYNGTTDLVEDQVNGSDRPLAAGRLTLAQALVGTRIAAVVAIAGAVLLGWPSLLMVLAFLALGWAYSAPPLCFKTRTGAAAVVAGVGGVLTYAAGHLAVAGGLAVPLLIFAGAMSAWMGFVGIQAKDLSDVEGDRVAGRRTIAVRWGERSVRWLVALTALAVGLISCAAANRYAPVLWLSAGTLLAGAACLSVCVLTRWSTGDRGRRRRPYRIFMATQYLCHAAVVVTLFVG